MADYYVQFSELLPKLNGAEQAWVSRVLGDEDDPETLLREAGIHARHVDLDDWPGFNWEIESSVDLWLYSEENGNVEHVGQFVRAFLARFRPAACWTLTWSGTCSKPSIGDFCGGGLFVTAKAIRSFDALNEVSRMKKRFEHAAARTACPT